MMKRICVFCGSNRGSRSQYTEAAKALGALFVHRAIGLVYGGGRVGLMGEIAMSMLRLGGEVIGVIPEALEAREVGLREATQFIVVKSMHERKAKMAELSDAFIAMPGGFGTFEEFFEIVTWAQLGMHHKPCGILNVEGYYDPLLALVDHGVNEEFIPPSNRDLIVQAADPEHLLDLLENFKPVATNKWIDKDEA